MDWVLSALEFLQDAGRGAWMAWRSPEFDRVRWALVAYIIGALQGYFAHADQDRAARAEKARRKMVVYLDTEAAAEDGVNLEDAQTLSAADADWARAMMEELKRKAGLL